MLPWVISSFKKKFQKHSLEQEKHWSAMFYLQFPVFIIYLYYLALLSALQTQQKHSQWRYAKCSLCRDPKWRRLHKMYLVFVCCLGTSLRGDQRNHLKFWEIVILYNYAEENHNSWRTRQDNGPKRVISWIHGSAKFHVELGPVLHNCSSRSHLSSNACYRGSKWITA